MSKSLGNVVDPVDIAERLVVEIVRLWVASVDFREDVTCSEHLMQRVAGKLSQSTQYLSLHSRNRFSDFVREKHAVPFEKLEAIDQYMLRQTAEIATRGAVVRRSLPFTKSYQRLNHFFAVELSVFYFDILKIGLYISAPEFAARRAAQTAAWRIGEALVRLLAPITALRRKKIGGICRRSRTVRKASTSRCSQKWRSCWGMRQRGMRNKRKTDSPPRGARRSARDPSKMPKQQADRRKSRGTGVAYSQ